MTGGTFGGRTFGGIKILRIVTHSRKLLISWDSSLLDMEFNEYDSVNVLISQLHDD